MSWHGSASTSRPTTSSSRSPAASPCTSSRWRTPIKAHQRPKLERYDETLFVVLRPARYVDESETVVFGEVHVFAGANFVITVRHGDAPNLGNVRRGSRPAGTARAGSLRDRSTRIVDHVVDGYPPVVAGLENDIDEIEDEVFSGERLGLPPHLRADAGGDRVPAGHQAAGRHSRGAHRRCRASMTRSARYLRDVHDHSRPHRGPRRRVPHAAPEHPQRPFDARDQGTQRGSQPPRTSRSRRSPPGRRSSSRRRSSARSTA